MLEKQKFQVNKDFMDSIAYRIIKKKTENEADVQDNNGGPESENISQK